MVMAENGRKRVKKEEVIAKIKDDGDFDRLRLKIIRKLKDNEELRNNIISVIKQSTALTRPGSENLKPRQLSDAIYEDVGERVQSQISDGLWAIIRSEEDGMKSEIAETVESVYNKLVNPEGVDEPTTSHVSNEADNGCPVNAGVGDSDSKETPVFVKSSNHNNNVSSSQHAMQNVNEVVEEQKHEKPDFSNDEEDPEVPPGFG